MRLLLQTLMIFGLLTAYTGIRLPGRYDTSFPRQPGPRFDHQVRKLYINALNERQPELVLLGDSTLGDAVDAEMLAEMTGKDTMAITIPGSASALWYLMVKNSFGAADYKPKDLLILFRDTILTAPGYRVQGSYFTLLDEFAYPNDQLLHERAFTNLMNPLEFSAEKYWPLYGTRLEVHREADAWLRYRLTGLAGCDQACTDESMYLTFGAADLEPGQLREAVAAAERYLYTSRQMDFQAQVERSFLPEIIHLAKDNGIRLIAVRLKSYASGTGDFESPALKNYIVDLKVYLTERGVPLLDYGTDPRLKREYFGDALHLNSEGRQQFTEMLAESLGEIGD